MKKFSFLLPDELYEELKLKAQTSGQSMAQVCRDALQCSLGEDESDFAESPTYEESWFGLASPCLEIEEPAEPEGDMSWFWEIPSQDLPQRPPPEPVLLIDANPHQQFREAMQDVERVRLAKMADYQSYRNRETRSYFQAHRHELDWEWA